MKIKTVRNGEETVRHSFEAFTRGQVREVLIALGFRMETDPVKNGQFWVVYCA